MKDNRHALRRSILSVTALLLCTLAILSVEANSPDSLPTPAADQTGQLGLAVSGASAGITTDYFEQALVDSILSSDALPGVSNKKTADINLPMIGASGTFSGVNQDDDAPYLLDIRIIKIDAPSFSIRMEVSMDVVWKLYDRTEKTTLLQQHIHSTYTGGAFEGGLLGANRVRAAVEGAARENIRIGVGMLASLDLAQD
jgi:hypothetical protein